jgi:hypothetical protein
MAEAVMQWAVPGMAGVFLEAWVDRERDTLVIKIRKEISMPEDGGTMKRGALISVSEEAIDRLANIPAGGMYPTYSLTDISEFLGAAGDFAKVAAEANLAVQRLRSITGGLDQKIAASALELGLALKAFSTSENPDEPETPGDDAGAPA